MFLLRPERGWGWGEKQSCLEKLVLLNPVQRPGLAEGVEVVEVRVGLFLRRPRLSQGGNSGESFEGSSGAM